MSRFSDGDPAYLLVHQYRTDSNLKTRMSVHERFRTNPLGWHRWVFDQLPSETAARVLELGAGNGALWRENIERLPVDWTVIITDFSAGVLESARRGLGTVGTFDYEVVDAQALPFEADRFDIVLANHMLYHVPARAKAIGNVRAVLRVAPFSHRRMESITFVSWMPFCATSCPAPSRTTRRRSTGWRTARNSSPSRSRMWNSEDTTTLSRSTTWKPWSTTSGPRRLPTDSRRMPLGGYGDESLGRSRRMDASE
jgi:SAM-dependent methyltransferase